MDDLWGDDLGHFLHLLILEQHLSNPESAFNEARLIKKFVEEDEEPLQHKQSECVLDIYEVIMSITIRFLNFLSRYLQILQILKHQLLQIIQKITPQLDLIPKYTNKKEHQILTKLNIKLILNNIKHIIHKLRKRAINIFHINFQQVRGMGFQRIEYFDIDVLVLHLGFFIVDEEACLEVDYLVDWVCELLWVVVVVVVVWGG